MDCLSSKSIEELERLSRLFPYIMEFIAHDLTPEQLAALNRYNGQSGMISIHKSLSKDILPPALSITVLSFLTNKSESSISKILMDTQQSKHEKTAPSCCVLS